MTHHLAHDSQPLPRQRVHLFAALLVVLAIVIGAWYVGGQQGFGQIGQGGQNLKLLPRVGEPAPDITVMLTDGQLVQLSDFRGQPVWLNFWGSWCPPCRAEMPDMQAAYEELAPRGLVMLAISLDEPLQTAADYAARNGATYLIGSDPQRRSTGRAYPIVNFPSHILIDRDGIVREVILSVVSEEEFVTHGQALIALPEETE